MEQTKNQNADYARAAHMRGRSQNPNGFYGSHNTSAVDLGLPEENLKLVPCRWSHTGWKYVQADPGKTHFFKNPNRVNSFGFNKDVKDENIRRSKRMT